MAARVIEDLRKSCELAKAESSRDRIALAFVYCSSLTPGDNDPKRLLGSILKQLLEQLPIFENVPLLEKTQELSNEPPSIKEIKTGITAIVSKFSRTFVVFDGLDECSRAEQDCKDTFEGLCNFVAALTRAHVSNALVKAIVFSRPEYPQIEAAFTGCRHVRVDDGANDVDIKQYILTKTTGLLENQEALAEIRNALLSRADGMFLWVNLIIKALEYERSPRNMKRAVNNLPQSLNKVYQLSMERVLKQPESVKIRALRTILWTTNAKRPLSRHELREVLSIEPNSGDWDDTWRFEHDKGLLAECGDLVVLVDDHYQLIHSSLKDYLTKTPSTSTSLEEYRSMQIGQARIIAEICLTYLNLDIFKRGPAVTPKELAKLQKDHPFLEYAATFWGNHVVEVEESQYGDLESLAKAFLFCDDARELGMQNMMKSLNWAPVCPYPGKTTPLHLTSAFNLVRMAELMPNPLQQIIVFDGFGYLPLDYALRLGSHEMADWLLHKHLEASEQDPLYALPQGTLDLRVSLAAIFDWDDAIRLLFKLSHEHNEKTQDIGLTPLHFAAMSGAGKAVDALLSLGADINATDNSGKTPLFCAVQGGQSSVAMKLINAKADVTLATSGDSAKETALHYAAINGDIDIARALLQNGANINALTDEGRSPLYCAVEEDQKEMVQFLITQKNVDVEGKGPRGWNSVLVASNQGFKESLEMVLTAGANVNVCNEEHDSAVHLAAENGRLDILKILIGENYHIFFPKFVRQCCRNTASWRFHADPYSFLDHGAEVNELNKSKKTPLYAAIVAGELETAKVLVHKYKADPTVPGFMNGNALHFAAINTDGGSLLPLLLDTGIDTNSRISGGSSALHLALKPNNLEVVTKLVNAVPGLALTQDDHGRTPLHSAARMGSLDLVNFLLHEADPSKDIRDAVSDLPLHLAASAGHLECVKLLMTPENVNDRGWNSTTPLHRASTGGHISVVRFLLQNGAKVDMRDSFEGTPLLLALIGKHLEVANLLLDNGADPKIGDENGWTPLHIAAGVGNKDFVIRLLDLGCTNLILHKPPSGFTPFMQAARSGNSEIVDLFLERGFDGTDILSNEGWSCIQLAASGGHLEVFSKLKDLNPESLYSVGYLGSDALHFAAGNGQLEMIERLLENGFGPEGLQKGKTTPLHDAVLQGYFEVVDTLLKLGANVNARSDVPWRPSTLHMSYQNLRITEKLLESGADPFDLDSFHCTPLDYAHPHVKERMAFFGYNYRPTDMANRIPTLRNTVVKLVADILALSETPDSANVKGEYEKVNYLFALGKALASFKTDVSIDESKICYVECASLNNQQFQAWTCNLCMREHFNVTRYKCLDCFDSDLCEDCHKDYITVEESSGSILQGRRVLEKLETQVYAARLIGQSYRKQGRVFVATMSLLENISSCWDWVNKMQKQYEEWEQNYNKSNRFDVRKIPGWQFLKLIEKAPKVQAEARTDVNVIENIYAPFAKELTALYHEHKADKELKYFICNGHKYMEIPTKLRLTDDQREWFDSEGKLTSKYLRSLMEKYGKPDKFCFSDATTEELPGERSENLQRDVDQNHLPASSRLGGNLFESAADLAATPTPTDANRKVDGKLDCFSKTEDGHSRTPDLSQMSSESSLSSGTVDISSKTETRNSQKEQEGIIPHWLEKEAEYLNRLLNNFPQLRAIRNGLLAVLRNVYQPSPDLNDIVSTNAETIIDWVRILEAAWQFAQIILVGFVSRTLTEHLSNFEDPDNESSEAGLHFLPTEEILGAEIVPFSQSGSGEAGVQDKFLDSLPDDIRKELEHFVIRARQLRKKAIQNTVPQPAPDEMTRKLSAAMVDCISGSPFTVYDYYRNPVLPRLICQPRV